MYPLEIHKLTFSRRFNFREILNLNIICMNLAVLLIPIGLVILSIFAIGFVLAGFVITNWAIWNFCSKENGHSFYFYDCVSYYCSI